MMANSCRENVSSDPAVGGSITFPATFSILDNPEDSLRPLFRIAWCATKHARPRISINQRHTKKFDLAADSLLGIVLKEARKESAGRKHARFRGVYPADKNLRREMDEIGTVKALFSESDTWNVSLTSDVKVFRHRQSGVETERTIDTPDPLQSVTQQFADHINKCLATINKKLTPEARQELCVYVGEVLANAQEHPGLTDWTVVAYLDPEVMTYEVAIINFGATIAQTFKSLESGSFAHRDAFNYVRNIIQGKRARSNLDEDSLLTVVALQGNVSSKNTTEKSDRGQGTVEMIEFFQSIVDECGASDKKPQMALVSGSTHIVL